MAGNRPVPPCAPNGAARRGTRTALRRVAVHTVRIIFHTSSAAMAAVSHRDLPCVEQGGVGENDLGVCGGGSILHILPEASDFTALRRPGARGSDPFTCLLALSIPQGA